MVTHVILVTHQYVTSTGWEWHRYLECPGISADIPRPGIILGFKTMTRRHETTQIGDHVDIRIKERTQGTQGEC